MGVDALAALSVLPDVQAACDVARTEIDALLWRRDIRSAAAEVAADSRVRGARDSAAIDGADVAVADDSPMGRVLEAAERVTAAVPGQVEAFGRAPLQVLAHLHALTAVGFCEPDQLGRPRRDDSADDPLLLGNLPTALVWVSAPGGRRWWLRQLRTVSSRFCGPFGGVRAWLLAL